MAKVDKEEIAKVLENESFLLLVKRMQAQFASKAMAVGTADEDVKRLRHESHALSQLMAQLRGAIN